MKNVEKCRWARLCHNRHGRGRTKPHDAAHFRTYAALNVGWEVFVSVLVDEDCGRCFSRQIGQGEELAEQTFVRLVRVLAEVAAAMLVVARDAVFVGIAVVVHVDGRDEEHRQEYRQQNP